MGAWVVKNLVLFIAAGVCTVVAQEIVLLQSVELTSATKGLPLQKVEAGAALACALTQRFRLVTARDSVAIVLYQRRGSLDSVAAALGATWTMSIRLDRFENLLRTELLLKGHDTTRRGIGYALVRHRWEQSDQPVADPAVLLALQRALCVALGDSLLYAQLDSADRVRPAHVITVASIQPIDNPSLVPRWELFDDLIGTSYSGVLAAIVAAQKSPYYVALDVDTRDSMYARFRLYEPEPTMPPSWEDVAALAYFGVEGLIAGTIERTTDGAQLSLHLLRIENEQKAYRVRSVERRIVEDSRLGYLEAVMSATQELLATPLPSAP